MSTRPSVSSTDSASRSDARLMPHCSESMRCEGSRCPGPSSPALIWSWMRAATSCGTMVADRRPPFVNPSSTRGLRAGPIAQLCVFAPPEPLNEAA